MLIFGFKPVEEKVIRSVANPWSLLIHGHCSMWLVVIYTFLSHLAFTYSKATRDFVLSTFFHSAVMTLQGSKERKKKPHTAVYRVPTTNQSGIFCLSSWTQNQKSSPARYIFFPGS